MVQRLRGTSEEEGKAMDGAHHGANDGPHHKTSNSSDTGRQGCGRQRAGTETAGKSRAEGELDELARQLSRPWMTDGCARGEEIPIEIDAGDELLAGR
jgi:hypothetical protein